MRSRVRRAVPLGLLAPVLAAVLIPGLSPAHAATAYTPASYAARLLTLFNGTRQQHGLKPLQVATGTQTVATGWSQHLSAAGALSHNPNLQHELETHGSKDWTVYGENVGDADSQDPDGLFAAYMASPEHKRNILTPEYRYIGNAVVFTDGRAWNTMDFVDEYGAAARTSASKVATAPRKSAPTHASRTPSVRHLKVSRPAQPTPAAAKPQALPHADRGSMRTPLVAPARWTQDTLADHPISGSAAVAFVPTPNEPTSFDTRRILLLAAAAMLALHAAGAWAGVAASSRRRRTRTAV